MVFLQLLQYHDELYRGWAGGRGVGWALGVGGKPKAGIPSTRRTNSSAVSSVGHRNCHSPTWQAQTVVSSSLTPPNSLISAHHWPHRPCSGPSWFYRVGKRPPVKADLAIYSLVVGMSGLWVNVATMLNNKLDFYCCDNSVGFCKSSHKCTTYKYVHIRTCIIIIS